MNKIKELLAKLKAKLLNAYEVVKFALFPDCEKTKTRNNAALSVEDPALDSDDYTDYPTRRHSYTLSMVEEKDEAEPEPGPFSQTVDRLALMERLCENNPILIYDPICHDLECCEENNPFAEEEKPKKKRKATKKKATKKKKPKKSIRKK